MTPVSMFIWLEAHRHLFAAAWAPVAACTARMAPAAAKIHGRRNRGGVHKRLQVCHGPVCRRFRSNNVVDNGRVSIKVYSNLLLNLWKVPAKFGGVRLGLTNAILDDLSAQRGGGHRQPKANSVTLAVYAPLTPRRRPLARH